MPILQTLYLHPAAVPKPTAAPIIRLVLSRAFVLLCLRRLFLNSILAPITIGGQVLLFSIKERLRRYLPLPFVSGVLLSSLYLIEYCFEASPGIIRLSRDISYSATMQSSLCRTVILLGGLLLQLVLAQQYAGDVIPNSLGSVPGSELVYFKIKEPNGKTPKAYNLTLTNYQSLQTNGQRIVPSQIQRAVIIIHGLDRDPGTYISNVSRFDL